MLPGEEGSHLRVCVVVFLWIVDRHKSVPVDLCWDIAYRCRRHAHSIRMADENVFRLAVLLPVRGEVRKRDTWREYESIGVDGMVTGDPSEEPLAWRESRVYQAPASFQALRNFSHGVRDAGESR